jgi:hypothetical protein
MGEKRGVLVNVRGLWTVTSASPSTITVCLPQRTVAKPDHDSRGDAILYTKTYLLQQARIFLVSVSDVGQNHDRSC